MNFKLSCALFKHKVAYNTPTPYSFLLNNYKNNKSDTQIFYIN